MAETYKQRLDGCMRDQRNLIKRVGELERSQALARKRPEDEFWGEEAGRRFAEQQEELVALKEENSALKELMESGVRRDNDRAVGMESAVGAPGTGLSEGS